jgi:hypothetical protein
VLSIEYPELHVLAANREAAPELKGVFVEMVEPKRRFPIFSIIWKWRICWTRERSNRRRRVGSSEGSRFQLGSTLLCIER